MAVRRKPNTVDEFINAGGTVPERTGTATLEEQTSEQLKPEQAEEEIVPVTLRVPGDLLKELDASAKRRRSRRSRNSWILEAIIEKLEREEKS